MAASSLIHFVGDIASSARCAFRLASEAAVSLCQRAILAADQPLRRSLSVWAWLSNSCRSVGAPDVNVPSSVPQSQPVFVK